MCLVQLHRKHINFVDIELSFTYERLSGNRSNVAEGTALIGYKKVFVLIDN